jgi:hypothetical protein
MKTHIRILGLLLVVLMVTLACNISQATPTQDTGLIQTQTSLAITLEALNSVPPTANVQPTLEALPTYTLQQVDTVQPTNTVQPPSNSELSAAQIQEKINSSNILIYEDISDYPEYLPVVSRAIAPLGGNHVYVADAMGKFMEKMDSGTKWDLIIMAAEARTNISGEYWTAIQQQVDQRHAALIAEIWYLDKINDGKISPFLYECGIDVQRNWVRPDVFEPVDFPIYWVESDSPVFSTPNRVDSFRASNQNDVWMGDIGDLMELTGGGDARILGSRTMGQKSADGLLTSCIKGTVLFQTFDTHDYPSDKMTALWQNYIMFTLTNHFKNNP